VFRNGILFDDVTSAVFVTFYHSVCAYSLLLLQFINILSALLILYVILHASY